MTALQRLSAIFEYDLYAEITETPCPSFFLHTRHDRINQEVWLYRARIVISNMRLHNEQFDKQNQ